MDKAQNNGTMLEELRKEIKTINRLQRLRRAGHVLNLIVEAILYGGGTNDFTREIIECGDARAFELWRKFGAIGKVHSRVKFIMRSDQRRQEFIKGQRKGDDD